MSETDAPPQPASAIIRSEPPASPPAAAPEAPPAPPASDVDLDLDSEFIQFTVKLGGRKFKAIEASIETQKAILRALPTDDSKSDDEEKTGAEERDETLRNIDSIYPQLEHILFHLDGEEKGRPPAKEFVEEHLRTSTLRALMQRLSPDEDAEGKSSSA